MVKTVASVLAVLTFIGIGTTRFVFSSREQTTPVQGGTANHGQPAPTPRYTTRQLISRRLISSHTKDEATLVQEGAKTDKQKVHGKLFSAHKTGGRKLRDVVATETGDVVVISTLPKGMPGGNPGCPSHPRATLRNLAHVADAVVVGTVKSKVYSQLTENEEFVFSDYELTIEDILKNNAAKPIQLNNTIIATRPGGTVQLKGRVVRALAGNFKPFKIGERYLLLLKFVPASASYQAFGNRPYLLRSHTGIPQLEVTATAQEQAATTFINQVRAAVTAGPCGSAIALY